MMNKYSNFYILQYLINFISFSEMLVCFLARNRKGIDTVGLTGQEEIEGIGEGEIINKVSCINKTYTQ